MTNRLSTSLCHDVDSHSTAVWPTQYYLRTRGSTAHEAGSHPIPPFHCKRVELPVQLADRDRLWIHHIYFNLRQQQRQAREGQGI